MKNLDNIERIYLFKRYNFFRYIKRGIENDLFATSRFD